MKRSHKQNGAPGSQPVETISKYNAGRAQICRLVVCDRMGGRLEHRNNSRFLILFKTIES